MHATCLGAGFTKCRWRCSSKTGVQILDALLLVDVRSIRNTNSTSEFPPFIPRLLDSDELNLTSLGCSSGLHHGYDTVAKESQALARYFDFYNHRRPHSTPKNLFTIF